MNVIDMSMRNKINVDNAIILAAGFSSRFVPLCFDIPKGLLPVMGDTLIERQIKQMHEVGIDDITIITGAYREQFDFLQKKHNVNLIYNSDYSFKNNFSSVYTAREILKNTIISSSDLFFPGNIFENTAEHSYFTSVYINGNTNQRTLTLDNTDRIIKTVYGGCDTWITFGGLAFLTAELSETLIEFIEPVYDDPRYANKYWVDFHDEHIEELPMWIKRLNSGDTVEFNTLESLWDFDKNFCACEVSITMQKICSELSLNYERQIKNIKPIMEGNSAIGCYFNYNNNSYECFCKNKFDLQRKIN